jgi:hypothetical protein
MFEDRRRDAWRWPDVDATLDPERWAAVDDPTAFGLAADWDRPGYLEALTTADPELWPPPRLTPAPDAPRPTQHVLADGEAAPMSAALVAALCSIDPAALSEAEGVSLAVGLARAESHVAARKLAAVATVARRDPIDDLDPARWAWAELGAAMRLGDGGATQLVHLSRRLACTLPASRDALERGDLTVGKAMCIADATEGLTSEECAAVEARVVLKAANRTPAQHGAAVRRAVETIAPESREERRERRAREVRLTVTHFGNNMGEALVGMTSIDLEVLWLGADTWARRAKADSDDRTLDELRVAALVRWAESFLTHGDPTRCDRSCEPRDRSPSFENDRRDDQSTDGDDANTPSFENDGRDDRSPQRGFSAPRRHGRPVTVNLTIGVPAAIGLSEDPGELLGTGMLIPPDAIRDVIPDARLRRLLFDEDVGCLVDLGQQTYRPGARLAEFVALRDVTAGTPTGSQARAEAQDLDHISPYGKGGATEPDNLHSPTRRWHRAKTLAGWTVVRNPDQSLTWTSPLGRTYHTTPHDYRTET